MNAIFKDVLISTDKNQLDLDYIYTYLSNSYWAKDRTRENILLSINNSICFGVYFEKKQIGFARLVTDYGVFAYLMDVFILTTPIKVKVTVQFYWIIFWVYLS